MHPFEIFDNIMVVFGFTDFRNSEKDDKLLLSKKLWTNRETSITVG